MKRYLTVCILGLLIASCANEKIVEEDFNSYDKSSLDEHIQVDDKLSTLEVEIAKDPQNEANQVLKAEGEGRFSFLIDQQEGNAKQYELAFTIAASKSSDIGYVSLLDKLGNKALGIDFSDNSVTVANSDKQFAFHEKSRVKYTVKLNLDKKQYSLAVQEQGKSAVKLLENKAFNDPQFEMLSKLEFVMDGSYIIDDVSLKKI